MLTRETRIAAKALPRIKTNKTMPLGGFLRIKLYDARTTSRGFFFFLF